MALEVGTRLGHYDVSALIGEGGMGQVYRATDTQLGRDVALKILPDAFAADPDRLARFQREAQVLASLNHPNIAQIHGIEKSDDTQALVLELVEGPTLADRIAKGPIPLDEALSIAKQIAEALEAAHEAGVIHRDLKPANIKVREDGTVKVLDFGLAKAMDTTPEGDPSQSPTLTAAATQVGVIMGTAAYMSPEQARGKSVDKRADIWAFGCVLYEMLTGRRAFQGEDVSLTLAKVLEKEPTWDVLPSTAPARVANLLRRCLEKDPRERVQAVGDVRLAMQGAFETATDGPEPIEQPARSPAMWQRPAPMLTAAVLLVTASLLAGRALAPEPLPTSAVVRLSVVLPDGVRYTAPGSFARGLAVSSDGTQIVFTGRAGSGPRQLLRRALNGRAVDPLPGTERGQQPFFSPDGRWVAFFSPGDEALKRVAIEGDSPPQTLVEGVSRGFGVWWEDEIVFGDRGALFRVSAEGGTPVLLFDTGVGARRAPQPVVVPETGDILYGYGASDLGGPRIAVLPADASDPVPLLDDATLVALATSGHLLFEREGVVLAAAFDPATRRLGPARGVLEEFAYDPARARPQVTVSPSGTLVYIPAPARADTATLAWVDLEGTLTTVGELPPDVAMVDLSPDGALAVVGTRETPTRVFLWDMVRQVPTGLEVGWYAPRWHPDGRHVALSRGQELVLLDVDDGSETTLVTEPVRASTPSFTADGETLAYTAIREGSGEDIFARLRGDAEPHAVVATEAYEHSPALSPDGRWLAFVSDESERMEVYVARFPSGAGRRRVTTNGGLFPRWRSDGRALFFNENGDQDQDGMVLGRMVRIGEGETLELGSSVTLFVVFDAARPVNSVQSYSNWGAPYDVAADGTRFLRPYRAQSAPAREIVVVQNWLAELAELVPAR